MPLAAVEAMYSYTVLAYPCTAAGLEVTKLGARLPGHPTLPGPGRDAAPEEMPGRVCLLG